MKKCHYILLILLITSGCVSTTTSLKTVEDKPLSKQVMLNALIIDGQNNHAVWPKSTQMMKQYLEETALFNVDIYRTANLWRSAGYNNYIEKHPLNDGKEYKTFKNPKTDNNFKPNFEKYDVIISNFGWKTAAWPDETKNAFEQYMKKGGGLVVVHAANNAFPNWLEFNKMIGLGGWGGRNETHGPYVYYNKTGELIRDNTKGNGGAHGPAHEFQIKLRNNSHPITKDLPPLWLHSKDELYAKLRGPAENMTILASAYPQNVDHGDARHEPVLMVINYHQGRIFHSTLGHDDISFASVGFITTFIRGAQWAASGKVTLPIPDDFPTAVQKSIRVFNK